MMIDGGDEFIKEERRWAREQEDRKDRRAREQRAAWTERTGYIATAAAVIAIVAIIAFVVSHQISKAKENDTRRVEACAAQGMAWMQVGGANGEKVCARLTIDVPK